MVVQTEKHGPSRRTRSQRGRPLARLQLEMLELRAVPATFLVNTFADTQAVNFVTGQDASGNISLRSAIMAANQTLDNHTIILQAGNYNLTIAGAGENNAATGDLDIRSNITIQGAGPGATRINANGLDRVFDVHDPIDETVGPITFRLQGVRVTGGVAGLADDPEGGGIRALSGDLIINNSVITGNVARGVERFGSPVDARGGGIWIQLTNASLIMNNTRIVGNQAIGAGDLMSGASSGAASGGGLFAQNGGESTASVTLTDVVFENNQALGGDSLFDFGGFAEGGGATFSFIQTVSLNRVDFIGNLARGGSVNQQQFSSGSGFGGNAFGGGYSAFGSSVAIIDSSFVMNQAVGGSVFTSADFTGFYTGGLARGGAVYHNDFTSFGPATTARFERSTFANNVARGGSVTFTSPNPFSEALASAGTAFGGGIHLVTSGPAFNFLINSTVSQNRAIGGVADVPPEFQAGGSAFGGGIFVDDGNPIISNSTIVLNVAFPSTSGFGSGGGIATGSEMTANVQLRSTIVALNQAPFPIITDKAFPNSPTADLDDFGISSLGNNLIGVGTSAFTNGVNGDLVGSTLAPLDPRIAPLALNGGRTATHALLPDSPAINAGSNALALTTDQRGPGFARVVGTAADIGAFERLANQPPVAVLNDAPNVTTPGVTLYTFIVTYTDPDGAINLASLGNNDILVTGPNGFAQVATFVQVLSVVGNSVTVVYSIIPPGGEFVPFDNGIYTITVLANSIADNGQPPLFVAQGPIGTFLVDLPQEVPVIPEPEPPPPSFPIIEPLLPPEVVVPSSDLFFQIFPDAPSIQFGVGLLADGNGTRSTRDDLFVLFDFANDARSLFRQNRPPAMDPAIIYGLAYRVNGYELPGSIRGEVFTDLEGSGNLNGDLPKRSNVVVFIDANENGILDPEERWTVTDASGKFEFLGVEAGRHPVRVLAGPRTDITFPEQPLHLIELTGTYRTATEVNFGLHDRRLRRNLPTSQGPSSRGPIEIDLPVIDVRPLPSPTAEVSGAEMGWTSLFLLAGVASWYSSSGRRQGRDDQSREN